jgi:hypothetical protein
MYSLLLPEVESWTKTCSDVNGTTKSWEYSGFSFFSLCVDCSTVEKLLICSTMLVSGSLCAEVNFLVFRLSVVNKSSIGSETVIN